MNRRKKNTVKLELRGHKVIHRLAINYVRVIIDAKLIFREHLAYAYKRWLVPREQMRKCYRMLAPETLSQIRDGNIG